ncbi:MAG: hypothetical protein GY940_43575 [bacterium]|nr:hypothetical protein [bacterium]
MKRLIFIFLDGVGIGKANSRNPFYKASAEYLPLYENGCVLPDNTRIKPIDACLGTEGMPMSATGQTTMFTGTNIPALIQEHRDSFPDPIMRRIIKEKSIFSILKKNNFNCRFLNAFPGSSHLYTPYHVHIRDNGEFRFSHEFRSQVKRALSVTTCMMVSNHMVPFDIKDIRKEKALYHDFTNQWLISDMARLPRFTPEKAAEIIFNTSREYDFLLYEFFQTDLYGHGFEVPECVDLIQQLNRLLKHLISLMDKKTDTLLITSDHGNLEDSTTQLHTYNPVLLLTWGNKSDLLRDRIDSLADVTPAVTELFLNGKG